MQNRVSARALSFCGIMAALGVVIMLLGGVLGVATYIAPLAASVCLLPLLYEFGRGSALMGFIVTAVLSALICADKEQAFFYIFIGYYPVVRGFFARIGARPLRILAKAVFFAAALAAMFAFLIFILKLGDLISDLVSFAVWLRICFFAALLLTLMLYDLALGLMERLYLFRLRPKLKFPNK